jgi:signal transduction histidine kinase
MTAIAGYLDLVNSGKVGELNQKQAAFIKTAQTNLERMNQLVSDLGDISRIETNHFLLDLQPIDPIEVVNETAVVFESQIIAKQQNLIIEPEANLPHIQADRLRLIQILSNLISNAHKYTPDGGLITMQIEAVVRKNQSVVQFTVKDTGIGIGDEEKARVFEKFFRSADREALRVPGTGLGLNITRHLINLHLGQIWFESQLRQGTTFYFTIPVASPNVLAV